MIIARGFVLILLTVTHINVKGFKSFIYHISRPYLCKRHQLSASRTTTVYSDNLAYPGSRFLTNGVSNETQADNVIIAAPARSIQKRSQIDSEYHYEISKIFPSDGFQLYNSDKSIRQNQVDKLIYRHLPEFNQASISTLMYRSAKEWKKTKISVISRHLSRITNYMSRLPADEWTAKDVSNAIYGLQYMRSDDVRVLRFLTVMSNIIEESLCTPLSDESYEEDSEEYSEEDSDTNKELLDFLNNPQPFIPANRVLKSQMSEDFSSNNGEGSLAIGKERSSADKEDSVSAGLICIDDLIEYSSTSLSIKHLDEKIMTPRQLSTMLYSLRGMRSDVKEVKNFLNSVNRFIYLGKSSSIMTFDAQGVSNILYGMQGMSSDCIEVRVLLTQLTSKIDLSNDVLDSQAIGNSLYGLKNMKSDHSEVRNLLRVLSNKINQSSAQLKSQEIANAIYGLQGMNSNHIEVKEILIALEKKIINSNKKEIFNAQEIGNALYGLQGMNSESSEVRKI